MIMRARIGLFAILLSVPLLAAAVPTADEVMQKNFFASKISAFDGDVVMTLVNKDGGERVRKVAMWSKLQSNGVDSAVMIRFNDPADIKGTGFLQIENFAGDDDIWVYLPALGKVRRLVSSNKHDSFFGTDFSYGDILLPQVSKYRHTLLRTEAVDGNDCYVVESVPVDDKVRTDDGYARKLSWIDVQNYIERKVDYYDTDNQLLKTQTTSDVKQVDPGAQRWMPMRREMVNHQNGHRTTYEFAHFALDGGIQTSYFSTRNLERY
jgi:outer membrane lipoprotein-sorting protein